MGSQNFRDFLQRTCDHGFVANDDDGALNQDRVFHHRTDDLFVAQGLALEFLLPDRFLLADERDGFDAQFMEERFECFGCGRLPQVFDDFICLT